MAELTAVDSSFLPPSVQKAVAAEPPKNGSLHDIEHIGMLMQENRSFGDAHASGSTTSATSSTSRTP